MCHLSSHPEHFNVLVTLACMLFRLVSVVLRRTSCSILQLLVSLVPTGAIINQQHSLDIQFEFFVHTSPVLGLFINNRLSCFVSVSERHFIQSYSVEFTL